MSNEGKKVEQALAQAGVKGPQANALAQAAQEFKSTGNQKGLVQTLQATAKNALQQAGLDKGHEAGKKGLELSGNEQQKTKAREALSHAM